MPKKAENVVQVEVETADQKLIRRVINPKSEAVCGRCGVRIVNVEKKIRCKYCWNCGGKIKWQ